MGWISKGMVVDEETFYAAKAEALRRRVKLQDFIHEALTAALGRPAALHPPNECDEIQADPIFGPMVREMMTAFRALRAKS